MSNKDLKLISDDLKERALAAAGEGITIVDAHLPEGGLLVNIYPPPCPRMFPICVNNQKQANLSVQISKLLPSLI